MHYFVDNGKKINYNNYCRRFCDKKREQGVISMVLTIVYNNIIIACAVAALIGAGVATLVFLLTGRKPKLDENGQIIPNSAITAGLRDNVEAFAGMYEPMYDISIGKVGKKSETFDAWAAAINETGNGAFIEEFNKKFGKYTKWNAKKNKKFIKAAKKMVKLFFKAGIIRSHDVYTVGDDTTAEKYHLVGDDMIETDKEYDVIAPFWQCGDIILEKGVIK